jgi:hypothetical protein
MKYASKMNEMTMRLPLVGVGELLLRLQQRLRCTATEHAATLQLDIEKHPETVGLHCHQTSALRAQGRCIASGLPRTGEIVALLPSLPEMKKGTPA